MKVSVAISAGLACMIMPTAASAVVPVPSTTPALYRAYERLHARAAELPNVDEGRNVVRHGRASDGRKSHAVVRSEYRRLWLELHPTLKFKVERERIYKAITAKRPKWPENKRIVYAWWMAKGKDETNFHCLANIIAGENAGWVTTLDYGGGHHNVYEAYGIPQSNPGTKMSSAGPDWRTNPITQIRWMEGYTYGRYGSPCNGLTYKRMNGVY